MLATGQLLTGEGSDTIIMIHFHGFGGWNANTGLHAHGDCDSTVLKTIQPVNGPFLNYILNYRNVESIIGGVPFAMYPMGLSKNTLIRIQDESATGNRSFYAPSFYTKYLKPFLILGAPSSMVPSISAVWLPASSLASQSAISPCSSFLFSRVKIILNAKQPAMVTPNMAVTMPYDFRKPFSLKSHTYEPATLPSCENALIAARATARLAGGRGNEEEIHE